MSAKKPPTAPRTYDVTFVQCELDKSTKETVKKWDPKFEATINGIDRMVTDGYKISVSHDSYHDCVGVFCTMPDKSHPHAGFCLTARGPDWIHAVKVLVYKHFEILAEHWDTVNNQPRQRDEWG